MRPLLHLKLLSPFLQPQVKMYSIPQDYFLHFSPSFHLCPHPWGSHSINYNFCVFPFLLEYSLRSITQVISASKIFPWLCIVIKLPWSTSHFLLNIRLLKISLQFWFHSHLSAKIILQKAEDDFLQLSHQFSSSTILLGYFPGLITSLSKNTLLSPALCMTGLPWFPRPTHSFLDISVTSCLPNGNVPQHPSLIPLRFPYTFSLGYAIKSHLIILVTSRCCC